MSELVSRALANLRNTVKRITSKGAWLIECSDKLIREDERSFCDKETTLTIATFKIYVILDSEILQHFTAVYWRLFSTFRGYHKYC